MDLLKEQVSGVRCGKGNATGIIINIMLQQQKKTLYGHQRILRVDKLRVKGMQVKC